MSNTNNQKLDVSNAANSNPSTAYNTIVNTLKDISEMDLKSVSHLLCTIRYPHRKNEDHIISPYLQKKAFQYISDSLYKPGKSLELLNNQNKQLKKDNKKLQQSKDCITHKVWQLNGSIVQFKHKHHHHISRIYAVAKCPPELKDNDLKAIIRNLIKQNKKEYNSDFIKLIIQVSQIGQISFNTAAESIKIIFNFLTGDETQFWLCINTISH
ncbi:4351_t:CDS:1 [Cetraspora pellucida]|uniref:4351_t:CDS:1 n=1 Tax=Cetraspora pellucida TaxID=1433469 RepID=A0A9N9DFS4_9GLOM|nr:4351_t:CDS:1 [Cetraspora pellucida]